jgi:hypothetical protein
MWCSSKQISLNFILGQTIMWRGCSRVSQDHVISGKDNNQAVEASGVNCTLSIKIFKKLYTLGTVSSTQF